MGELAAAIAHEVTQPITAIMSNAGTSLRLLAADSPTLMRCVRPRNACIVTRSELRT
jgi:C4-dicarboxylate-specific signal transduction histidine kinase